MNVQLLFIHGGMTFKTRKEYLEYLRTRDLSLTKTRKWKREYLDEQLANQLEIYRPQMPWAENAHYEDWKLHFERLSSLLHGPVILVGSSLGAHFLAKYLSENRSSLKILGLLLVAPPFDNDLPGEDLVNGFGLNVDSDFSLLTSQVAKIHLFFSNDDDVVPLEHAKKFQKIFPSARFTYCNHKNGHFFCEEFPEIVEVIKNLL